MAEMTAEEERRFRDYGGKDHCGGLSTIEARKVWAALDAERLESARLREEVEEVQRAKPGALRDAFLRGVHRSNWRGPFTEDVEEAERLYPEPFTAAELGEVITRMAAVLSHPASPR